jgi:hypothetical protein
MLGSAPEKPRFRPRVFERVISAGCQVVAGCLVSPPLLAYAEGYNRVSMNAANRKFGRDVFKESFTDTMRRMRPLMKAPR